MPKKLGTRKVLKWVKGRVTVRVRDSVTLKRCSPKVTEGIIYGDLAVVQGVTKETEELYLVVHVPTNYTMTRMFKSEDAIKTVEKMCSFVKVRDLLRSSVASHIDTHMPSWCLNWMHHCRKTWRYTDPNKFVIEASRSKEKK